MRVLRHLAPILWLISLASAAHEMPPAFVGIRETAGDVYEMHWRLPPGAGNGQGEFAVVEPGCERLPPAAPTASLRLSCPHGLAGRMLRLNAPPGAIKAPTMIAIEQRGGERQVAILQPGESVWRIPAEKSFFDIASQYTRLGIRHIWEGIDHLLFVACLVMIAGSFRRLLLTISGFTLAHSLTLTLSVLHLVDLPIPAVEAAIALSVIFVALEIARGPRDTLTWRYPLVIAAAFGLLHGFGFAAVLQSIGLPTTDLATGLLCFNLGVEIGQILFVAALIPLLMLLQRGTEKLYPLGDNHRRGKRYLNPRSALCVGTAYLVGGLATSWFAERALLLV